jgi:hypothetical protein
MVGVVVRVKKINNREKKAIMCAFFSDDFVRFYEKFIKIIF